MEYKRLGLVINRARGRGEVDGILDVASSDLFGRIPEDGLIREFDSKGRSMIDLLGDSASVVAVRGILLGLGLTSGWQSLLRNVGLK